MKTAEKALRAEIVARCREMNASGINQGASGNISARLGDRMLISPSAVPYEALEPQMIASLALDDESGAWEGPLKPSTEWRFHRALLRDRPDAGAVVHAHATYCTTLAIARKGIPACHYMVAAFGGSDVRCAGYARFGTEALSALALEAMAERSACLLANHGMIAIGETLAKAMWRAVELEALAKQYYLSLSIGGPHLLSETQIAETLEAFGGYGVGNDPGQSEATAKPGRARATGSAVAGKDPAGKPGAP